MTDGAAKLIKEFLKRELSKRVRSKLEKAFEHLTSRDPEKFWTSGQWMTEKTGGSDVAISQTIAKSTSDEDIYSLYGTKWFTSATTSQMCFTLARIEDEQGKVIPGSKGLSLFYVELRNSLGELDNMTVRRMKDKLGTKALPTAEVDFEGTQAYLIGNPGEGIKNISHLFNITRIYNAITTVGSFRRLYQLAEDYSSKRIAFGKPLTEQPLHKKMLDQAKEQLVKCQLLTFYTVKLLQEEERDEAQNPDIQSTATLLRLFTPLAKLYTAKYNMIWTSELIESFGGAGYIEDTGLPKFLRDSQVYTIWEGTTNVLSLDCLRAIQKENALEVYLNKMSELAQTDEDKGRLKKIMDWSKSNGTDLEKWQYDARDFSFELCETAIQILKRLVF
jgi:putative acyl-CoA dehydrogenase